MSKDVAMTVTLKADTADFKAAVQDAIRDVEQLKACMESLKTINSFEEGLTEFLNRALESINNRIIALENK